MMIKRSVVSNNQRYRFKLARRIILRVILGLTLFSASQSPTSVLDSEWSSKLRSALYRWSFWVFVWPMLSCDTSFIDLYGVNVDIVEDLRAVSS